MWVAAIGMYKSTSVSQEGLINVGIESSEAVINSWMYPTYLVNKPAATGSYWSDLISPILFFHLSSGAALQVQFLPLYSIRFCMWHGVGHRLPWSQHYSGIDSTGRCLEGCQSIYSLIYHTIGMFCLSWVFLVLLFWILKHLLKFLFCMLLSWPASLATNVKRTVWVNWGTVVLLQKHTAFYLWGCN